MFKFRNLFRLAALAVLVMLSAVVKAQTRKVFVYCPGDRDGLHAALFADNQWRHVGKLCGSDYGPWGSLKRMYHPSLCRATDGTWRLVFALGQEVPQLGVAYGENLFTWRPQDYPIMDTNECHEPVIKPVDHGFTIYFKSNLGMRQVLASTDFRHFEPDAFAEPCKQLWQRDTITVGDKAFSGQVFELSESEANALTAYFNAQAEKGHRAAERMTNDEKLGFPAKLDVTLTAHPEHTKAISDKLVGVFFEDISYAADGGLYGELIQNRDFEYTDNDRREWGPTTAWHSEEPIVTDVKNPLSDENCVYALVKSTPIWNEGWDGIAVEKGKRYNFSMFVNGKKQFAIALADTLGNILASGTLNATADQWARYTLTLKAKKTFAVARLVITPKGDQPVGIDMVSLFPQETFKNRPNGLRKDLAETIAALHPKFVRFPGGCMSHGQELINIYHWQHTVGPLEKRLHDFNIWGYHQTRGLGFYEYFQFCEDIGAEPLPVLAAGVPCQNSRANEAHIAGQQGGIPMSQMNDYIDELCNLIDWANGDPATNPWAKMRADAGHPAPFNMKYIGIGNEDIISTVFEERYEMICRALRERHPEIKICGTVGPFHAPSADYVEGWRFAREHSDLQDMVDEHYYESTGWFLNNRNYYDSYPRNGVKVYLGEWAASTPVKRPNMETALAEAIYMTDLERNADVVEMSSYAPLLCKDRHNNWNPDMIYFSNTEVRTTPAYEVQRLFSVNSGDRYMASTLKVSEAKAAHRLGASIVTDSKTGRSYLKLVNALPSEVNFHVEGIHIPATATVEQLSGTGLDDRKAKAQTFKTNTPTTLPPYSMRVMEIKN